MASLLFLHVGMFSCARLDLHQHLIPALAMLPHKEKGEPEVADLTKPLPEIRLAAQGFMASVSLDTLGQIPPKWPSTFILLH